MLADLIADREPVNAGQHDVEQDQVELSAPGQFQSARAVAFAVDAETMKDEGVGQTRSDRHLVLDDQYLGLPHLRPGSALRGF